MLTEGQTKNRTPISHPAKAGATKSKTIEKQNKKKKKKKKKTGQFIGSFACMSDNSCEVLNKLNSRSFRASSLSTYDFSTLYITLPHNLIKDKLRI